MQPISVGRKRMRCEKRLNTAMEMALQINRIDTVRLTLARPTCKSRLIASKYSPEVLVMRAKPMKDMAQQPTNTASEERVERIRSSMASFASFPSWSLGGTV